ncbi:MAG: tetratricopeptide repeat protein [Planctomycetaceae bacterium]|nr:tetratricopeptide repeat protein [Planctomycetaceae bacterium]
MPKSLSLSLIAILTLTTVVNAQPNRNIPGLPAAAPNLNPEHENTKKEAEQAYRSAQFLKVDQLTSKVISENPKDHVALYLRGSARVELGIRTKDTAKIRQGIADCRGAILHDTQEQSMYYLPYLYGMSNLARLEDRPQHADVAIDVATSTLNGSEVRGEDRANLLYQRAYAKQSKSDFDGAIADYRAAIKEFPAHLGSHVAMAETLVKAGKVEEAKAAFAAALETFPDSPLIFNNRGMFFQQQNMHEEAIQDFTSALKQDANYYTSYTNRGFSLMQMGNPSAAVIDFNESLKRNPNQIEVYRLRASANLAQGKAEQAIADYQQMLKLDPSRAVAKAEMGFAQFFAGQYQAAFDSLSAARKMDADLRYVDPWRYLALSRLGQEEKAKSLFSDSLQKLAIQRDWIDSLIAYQAGAIEMRDLQAAMSQKDENMKASQQCEADFFTAHRMLKVNEGSRAREHFQKAIESGKKHLSAYRGARYALKQFETANSNSSTPN